MTLFVGTALEAGLRQAIPAAGATSGAPPRSLRGPKLLGTGRIGDVVDVDPGDWTDAAALSFSWLRNDVPIPGAIEASYAPSAGDDLTFLSCRVTATNEAGRTEVRTQTITIRFSPAASAGAFLYIRYRQLTGPHIVIEFPFFPDGSLSFRITGDGVSVDPATGLVTIPAASLLSGVSLLMTSLNSGEKAAIDFNLKLNPRAISTIPTLVASPAVSGSGLVGEALALQPGVWKGEPVPELTFQWLCDGAPIAGATALAFTPGDAEDGAGVSCRVTARNAAGETAAETVVVEIVRAAPVTIRVLDDVVLAQGGAAEVLQAAALFAGNALRFFVAGAGAEIDPDTGDLTLSTDALRKAEIVTVTARNSGGDAVSSFPVTVLASPTAAGSPAAVVLAQGSGAAEIATAAYFAGSDLVFSLAGAFAGAAIDAASGVMTFATDAPLATRLEIRATNAVGAASQIVPVAVLAAPTAARSPTAVVLAQGSGKAEIATASYFAGPDLVFSLGNALAGMAIDDASGVVTLMTDAPLTTRLEVRATNAAGAASQIVPVTVQAAIFVVASKNTAGPSSSVSGLIPGDDVLVVVRRLDSASAPLVPTGNPLGYRIVATATGAATGARMFHVRVKSSMLTGGVFSTGTFANVGTSKTFVVALRNVVSITDAMASGGLRTSRAFSALPALSTSANVVGFSFASAGVSPVPAEATILQDSSGRLWHAGPTAAWSPATAAAGSNVDWLEMAIGLTAAPVALGVPTPISFVEGAQNATVAAAGFFAGANLVYTLEVGPAGAVIDAASGVVTLSTAAPGKTTMVVRATNAAGAAVQSFETSVLGAPVALGLAGSIVLAAGPGTRTVSTASFFAGENMTFALEASPAGATIDAVSGLATIPIATAAKTVLSVRATNLAGSVVRNFALTILTAPVAIGGSVALLFERGSGTATISSQAFFAGDEIVFSLAAAPAGVTVNPNSGLVAVATDTAFEGAITLYATNAAGSATQRVVLKIGAEGPVSEITPAAPLDGEWTLDQITVQK